MIKRNIRKVFRDREINLSLARTLSACSLLLLLSVAAFGQSAAAVISGSVVDENGGMISGAVVRLTSRTGGQFNAVTDEKGTFALHNLPAGDYLLEAQADGFATYISGATTLERGQAKRVEITLKVDAVSENLVITAAGTPQRADEVSKVVTTLDEEQIEQKHTLNLSETLRGIPGVRVQQQGSPGALSAIRIRGQRTFDTAILLEGLRVRDASDIGGSAASLTTDLVPVSTDRVEILRGAGSSIYGTNAIGGVVNLVPETALPGLHFELGADAGGLRVVRRRSQRPALQPRAGVGHSQPQARSDGLRRQADPRSLLLR